MHSPTQVFGAADNTSCHGSESASPHPEAQQQKQTISVEDSRNSSEEEGRKGTRRNWIEEENKDLANAWVRHSVDPIKGIDQKGEYYWRAIIADFNNNKPKNMKMIALQCKTHWGGIKRDITKFCEHIPKLEVPIVVDNLMTWWWRKLTSCTKGKTKINLSL
jgi:hypothetical protein